MRLRALLMSVQSAPRSGVRSGSISRRLDSAEPPYSDGMQGRVRIDDCMHREPCACFRNQTPLDSVTSDDLGVRD